MKKENKVTLGLFIIYLIILSWIILFKMALSLDDLQHLYRSRSINFIPFGQSAIVNGAVYLNEIINNAIAFIPIGVYIELLKPDWSFIKKVGVPFGISFLYEIIQLIFAIGTTDITDLINNTLGGVLGIFICLILRKVLKDKVNKFVNILASICTTAIIALMFILIITNF